jgi:PAT family beta-lactamase induction signal transducer AmpG
MLTLKALWTRDSIIQIVSSALYRTGAGVMSPVFPILATTALTFDEATYSSTASALKVGIGFALIPIGTFATTRMGPKRAAILIYLLLALLSLFISGGKELWLITLIFVAMFALNSMTNALAMICGNAMRMELCDPRVAATQFTIYNSLSNLPLALGTGVFAMLGGTKELTIVVLASAALFVLAAVVLLFIRIGGPQAREVPPS